MPGDRPIVTATEIKRRLAYTKMPVDPLEVVFPETKPRIPQAVRAMMLQDLTPAGVLIPIIERGASLSVLLTERSADLKHHPGQVSFPGGRMETSDADIRATALRETHEEVGIHPSDVDVCGYLKPTATGTGYAVTPVVGFVNPAVELVLDTMEVQSAFEVPLDFLMDERNQEDSERIWKGASVPVITFHHREYKIWGATAGMLVALRHLLSEQ
jgi:8-oxo-dGTP pyrophosphatase MutT (NUDIX family)